MHFSKKRPIDQFNVKYSEYSFIGVVPMILKIYKLESVTEWESPLKED